MRSPLALVGLLNAEPLLERCQRCKRLIDETKEFRDHKSYVEWKKKHMCQQCQDYEQSLADEETSIFNLSK